MCEVDCFISIPVAFDKHPHSIGSQPQGLVYVYFPWLVVYTQKEDCQPILGTSSILPPCTCRPKKVHKSTRLASESCDIDIKPCDTNSQMQVHLYLMCTNSKNHRWVTQIWIKCQNDWLQVCMYEVHLYHGYQFSNSLLIPWIWSKCEDDWLQVCMDEVHLSACGPRL